MRDLICNQGFLSVKKGAVFPRDAIKDADKAPPEGRKTVLGSKNRPLLARMADNCFRPRLVRRPQRDSHELHSARLSIRAIKLARISPNEDEITRLHPHFPVQLVLVLTILEVFLCIGGRGAPQV